MNRPKKITPKKGEESVWDYPRPPKMEPTTKDLKVIHRSVLLAHTNKSYRMLETSHPPVYYFPQEDVKQNFLIQSTKQTFCEFKGIAHYYHLKFENELIKDAAWYYPEPKEKYAAIRNFITFYPSKVEACYVNDEKVIAQAGDFYGGWITQDIKGPFKGIEGSWGW